jgi:hypothetical protein
MSNSSNNNSGLALRMNAYAHLAQVINPNSQIGPEPIQIPVTGCSLVAEMFCYGNVDLMILGFKAEIIRQTTLQSDGVMISMPPTPNRLSFLPPEEEELAQKAMKEFIPLETPHFEILLDEHPPIIRPALKADGLPARPTPQFPSTLHPNEYRKFLLAPVTHSPDLTVWSLFVIWEIEGKRQEAQYGAFQVTGNTGFKTFHPHGGSSPTPVNQVVDHWETQYNSSH